VDADTIFSICNLVVLPGWALLIFLPRWKWTLGLICAGLIPFVLGLVYIGLIISQGIGGEEGGGFGSVEQVSILFSNPYALRPAGSITWPSTCSSAAGKSVIHNYREYPTGW